MKSDYHRQDGSMITIGAVFKSIINMNNDKQTQMVTDMVLQYLS